MEVKFSYFQTQLLLKAFLCLHASFGLRPETVPSTHWVSNVRHKVIPVCHTAYLWGSSFFISIFVSNTHTEVCSLPYTVWYDFSVTLAANFQFHVWDKSTASLQVATSQPLLGFAIGLFPKLYPTVTICVYEIHPSLLRGQPTAFSLDIYV